jgi:N-acetylglucosaminyl-diphospho-decaprenol L-rhamnosyltransferase
VDLSIISVNYNSLEYLRPCVTSIYEWTRGISFEIIVVDNASPKGDIASLKPEFPEIKLVKSETNLGFAGANNLGFQHSAGDWVLFLNPDTKLTSSALNVMLEQSRSLPGLGIAGCRLLNGDGSVQTSSIMSFPGILNSLFGLEFLRLHWPEIWGIGPLFAKNPRNAEVEAISGACMLVQRQVFEQIGMFSENYFMYSEDIDLCYQAVRAGFKNYYIGQASMIHYGGTSSTSERQTTMKTTAELQFCEKNYGPLYMRMFRYATALNAIVRLSVIAVLRWFGVAVLANRSLDSASSRWNAVLKTLCSGTHTTTNRVTKSADYRTTSA